MNFVHRLKNESSFRTRFIIALIFSIFFIAVLSVPPVIIYSERYHIYKEADDVVPVETGIVFGAGVTKYKQPTAALRDRLDMAIDLYERNKINTIFISGDNRPEHDYETRIMKDYLSEHAIPEDRILVDASGRRTYDTCFRAHEVFSIDKGILITQGYHLPRALFLCNALGVKSSGISASQREYLSEYWFKLREILAIYKSVLDVYLLKPDPAVIEEDFLHITLQDVP